MPEYPKRLYMIVHPINALLASQLSPEQFAQHYTLGSAKHYEGKVIFAELDAAFRDPFFPIDDYLAQTVPHADGKPKKTKFICSYAVLEHVDLKALRALYLVTTNGKSLKLESTPYSAVNEPGMVRIYQEIAPLTNLVASTLDQRAFARYLTTETRAKGAPKVCFTQYEFNEAEFMDRDPRAAVLRCSLPKTHPALLHEYLGELRADPGKKTKTINLNSTLADAPYTLVRHGFWFAAPKELVFFPMPSVAELSRDHYDWWRFAN